MTAPNYDLVGDIHGHANPLHRLLDELGYAEIEGIFRHPERKMIFVGDFIDRGPEQREVLRIARSMCEAGAARSAAGAMGIWPRGIWPGGLTAVVGAVVLVQRIGPRAQVYERIVGCATGSVVELRSESEMGSDAPPGVGERNST
jgi:hypothetical protein